MNYIMNNNFRFNSYFSEETNKLIKFFHIYTFFIFYSALSRINTISYLFSFKSVFSFFSNLYNSKQTITFYDIKKFNLLKKEMI